MKIGDEQYLGKVAEYDKFRPKYSEDLIIMLRNKLFSGAPPVGIDIGAGTGIWTRQLLRAIAWKKLVALEPNKELFEYGEKSTQHNHNASLIWIKGLAESIPIKDNTVDFVSMASTFNWLDKEKALQEAHRILKKTGLICLVWNPIEKSKTKEMLETELFIDTLAHSKYNMLKLKKQVLSMTINEMLLNKGFSMVSYHEFEDIYETPLHNLKHLWTYTDKLKIQLEEKKFELLTGFLIKQFNSDKLVNYTCTTKCWLAKKI